MLGKKILGTVLAASMTLSLNVFAATGYTDLDAASANTPAALSNAVTELTALGVISGNDQGTFGAQDTVRRIDVATMFTKALGYGKLVQIQAAALAKDPDAALPIAGLDDEKPADQAAAIVANQKGIIKGVQDTTDNSIDFQPEESVTYGQIATVAVRGLGYTEADLDGTAWPYNYLAKAIEIGLFDNVGDVSATDPATKADVALVVDTMLNKPTKAEQAKADASAATVTDSTKAYTAKLLKALKFNFYATKLKTGIITATSEVANSGLKANQIQVGGDTTVTYTVPDTLLNTFNQSLGKTVSFNYDSSNNIKSLIDITSGNVVTPVTVSNNAATVAAPIDTVNSFVYYKDASSNLCTAKLDSNVKVFINGKSSKANGTYVYGLKDIQAGDSLRLVQDNTGTDSTVDYVVDSRTAVKLAPANAGSNDKGTAGTALGLNLKYGTANADSNVTVTVNGAAANLTDIQKNDLLYVNATDDNDYVNIAAIRKSFTGKATGIATDGSSVTVGSTVYGVADDIASSATAAVKNINLGTGYVFTYILDSNNKVAAIIDPSGQINPANATTTTINPNVIFDSSKTYGVLTGYNPSYASGWNGTVPAIQYTDLTGASKIVTLANVTSSTATGYVDANTLVSGNYGKLIYFTTDSNGNINSLSFVPTTTYNPSSKTANTKVLQVTSSTLTNGQKAYNASVVAQSAVNFPTAGTTGVYALGTAGSVWGDYYVMVAPDSILTNSVGTAANSLGIIASDVTAQLYDTDGTTLLKKYNVIENGVSKSVALNTSKLAQLKKGDVYSTLAYTGTNVSGETVVNSNYYQVTGAVVSNGLDTTNNRISLVSPTSVGNTNVGVSTSNGGQYFVSSVNGNNFIYNVASSVVVVSYNNSSNPNVYTTSSLSNIKADGTSKVTLVFDKPVITGTDSTGSYTADSTAKVVMVITQNY